MRTASAFTLVEALLAITIAAIGGSVLLLGTTSSIQTTNEAQERTIAEGMAQQLLDEVLGSRYAELGFTAHDVYLGASVGEEATGTRELFDDVDDFNGVRSQPPTDARGIELGRDNGQGAERNPNFRATAGFFDNWRQEIDVYYVSESNLITRLPTGQISDYRAVVVRIVYVDPQHGQRVLAQRRGVVAYVPPL